MRLFRAIVRHTALDHHELVLAGLERLEVPLDAQRPAQERNETAQKERHDAELHAMAGAECVFIHDAVLKCATRVEQDLCCNGDLAEDEERHHRQSKARLKPQLELHLRCQSVDEQHPVHLEPAGPNNEALAVPVHEVANAQVDERRSSPRRSLENARILGTYS